MKDNFSAHSAQYAKYRPVYPSALFDFIRESQPNRQSAWDCATGNGQLAVELAGIFEQVYATDISQAQMDHAPRLHNIHYSMSEAEQSNFPDDFFDLISVGQAVHWFDFERFYAEVNRTSKHGALIVLVGYGKIQLPPDLDRVVDNLYENILGQYWDPERRYIDEAYESLPFPFPAMDTPALESVHCWSFDQLIGYLGTWSALAHYVKAHGENPLERLIPELRKAWGAGETHHISFPMLLKAGSIVK